jgi:hypothetical protein
MNSSSTITEHHRAPDCVALEHEARRVRLLHVSPRSGWARRRWGWRTPRCCRRRAPGTSAGSGGSALANYPSDPDNCPSPTFGHRSRFGQFRNRLLLVSPFGPRLPGLDLSMQIRLLVQWVRATLAVVSIAGIAVVDTSCSRTGLPIDDGTATASKSADAGCRTCADIGAECGTISDGCGRTLVCGTCYLPEVCGGDGVGRRCGCRPTTCAALGAECGQAPDGCGGILSCGSCPAGETCGGAGPNRCGPDACSAATCAQSRAACGKISDGCNSVLDCGSCVRPNSCGGGGTANQCGCTPTTCAEQGAGCGSLSDGCGGTLDCGACTPPQQCGVGGRNHCGCVPTTCAAEDAHCGSILDGCGGVLTCGQCENEHRGRSACIGIGPTHCGEEREACRPTTCTRLGARCGMVSDGCAGILDCGTCGTPETCGGGGIFNHCGCTPKTCDAVGASCGNVSDGCGNRLDCGSCPAGRVCNPASSLCVQGN